MTTKNGIRCCMGRADDGSIKVHEVELPSGRRIRLLSKEGVDEFVDAIGTDLISTNLTTTDDQELTLAYKLMDLVAENASPEKIASGIPESELRAFVEHTRDTYDTLSTDRTWLRSGTVSRCHGLLLQTAAVFAKHPSFIKIFIFNKGMEAVAKLYASRKKNDTPYNEVAGSILTLVQNAFVVLAEGGVNVEKAFGAIERTGLLGQFIRCVPVYPNKCSADSVALLQTCLQLVKKKLKSGTPTGDILDAVIAGKDGPINEEAKSALTRLQTLARLSNNNTNNSGNHDSQWTGHKICGHCTKIETLDSAKLMKCQRCKVAYYCSKECQVANWKSHKKTCKALSSRIGSRSTAKTTDLTINAFLKSNYFDIVKEVYKKTQEYNVPKKELLLEIDFYEDAPALRNQFKIWLTSGVLEGSSVADAPDWFRARADNKTMKRYVKEDYERVKSYDLLIVCRAGNGNVSVQNLHFLINERYQFLSDEAVESIGREDYVRMVACLGQRTTDEYFREERSGLTWF
jgi:hypothetical protein